MKAKQHGTTVIEVLGAVAVGSMMLLGLTSMIDTSLKDTKGQQAALHQARIADAARKYISANYKTLKDTVHEPQLVATISVNDLIDQNFLPAGFSLVNDYNQSACVLVRQPVQGSGKLEALVVTSGGQAIEDKNIRVVAAHAGEGGGYIASTAPTTAQGTSWSVATADYQGVACGGAGEAVLSGTASDGGHLVSNLFYDGPGFTDFLYRFAVDGRPDLNKMYTPLRFTEDAIVAEGAACGSHAAIAADNSRNLLRCNANGVWSQLTSWKSPVADYNALAALTDKNDGDVRMTLDKKRAFSWDANSNKWVALAVDQNGDFSVERDLTAGRNATVANNVYAGNDLEVANRVHGTYVLADSWVIAEHFIPTLVKNPGDACNIELVLPDGTYYLWPVGSIARDANGVIMTCHDSDKTFKYANGTTAP